MIIINKANNIVITKCSDNAYKKDRKIIDGNSIVVNGLEEELDIQFLPNLLYDDSFIDYEQYIDYSSRSVLQKQNIPLEDYKKIKITELKKIGSETIYGKYSKFKQDNAALGVYDDTFKEEMVSGIKAYIVLINTAEEAINEAESHTCVDAVDISLEAGD